VIRQSCRHSYERLAAHEGDVGRRDDPESVHQARVATRRLRSDLHTFGEFVDEEWAAELRADLRWLGGELGTVRDIEVQHVRLHAHAGTLPPAEAEAARRVVRRLEADRSAAHVDLLATLARPRYAQVRAELAAAAGAPRGTAAADAPAAEALAPVLRRRWKKLRRRVRDLGDHPSDEALHATRVRAKQCRYAAEACEPVFGKRVRRLAQAMARVQDVLGEHRDAVVAQAWLAKTALECSPTEAYALGMLAQYERQAAAAARDAFAGVWRAADTERVRGWL